MRKLIIYTIFCILYITDITSAAPYIVENNYQHIDGITATSKIAMSGLNAQSERLKVISQNIANANVTGIKPNEDPYKRKIIFFKNEFDPQKGTTVVKVHKITTDQSPFTLKYQPHHPAAVDGYVKYPNVNIVVENIDAKEAERSFDVNTNVLSIAKNLTEVTINLIK